MPRCSQSRQRQPPPGATRRGVPCHRRTVFMMIARAAKEGCPSDAAIARAYGSHSLRRARRLLTYIEEQG
ncbi:MAG: hypothetical protein E5V34_11810, partial [Mesorhizobium sp.]